MNIGLGACAAQVSVRKRFTMGSLVRRWFKKNGEEISPWVGLAFGALYLCAVAGVGVAAVYVQRTELNARYVQDMEQWTHWLAHSLGHVQEDGPEAIAREVRRAAR